MNIRQIALLLMTAGLLLAAGIGIGWRLAQPPAQPPAANPPAATTPAPGKILYWYDPMAPQQHFPQPGKSPFMDMELVPRYAEPAETPPPETAAAMPALRIDPAFTQNLGLRLANVGRIPLAASIEVSGGIDFNQRDVAVVQSRGQGYVERTWPLAVGDVVRAGQPLADILLPEWTAAQQEYLSVRAMQDPTLLAAAGERLLLAGMPADMIRQLQRSGRVQTRYTVTAPIAGVIQALEVRNGMTLTTAQTLARINGLDTVWLDAALPEAQAEAIGVGANVEARLTAFPDRVFTGRVAAVLPALRESSRSLTLRIELLNRDRQLRPGQSARVTLHAAAAGSGLAVPTAALIRTGKRTLVMVADGNGRFTPTEVAIGREIGDSTLITAGLTDGQQIVASGQFLIDSEASLSGLEIVPLPGAGPQPLHAEDQP